MKRYIKNSQYKSENTFTIRLSVFYEIEPRIAVAASTNVDVLKTLDQLFCQKSVLEDISSDYSSFVQSVVSIIESKGFYMIEDPNKSPHSNSMYFKFCIESDFLIQSVEVIIDMRISDHDLLTWTRDTKPKDTIKRQSEILSDRNNKNYLWLNKKLETLNKQWELELAKAQAENPNILKGQSPHQIPSIYTSVKYNHDGYTTYGDVFAKINNAVAKIYKEATTLTEQLRNGQS